jgi:ferredoxin
VLTAEVDRARCCGYALCADACPEVFQLDDSGQAFVVGTVLPELEAKVRHAETMCPERAIKVRE